MTLGFCIYFCIKTSALELGLVSIWNVIDENF